MADTPTSSPAEAFAVAVAVGPDAREIDRLRDLADSVGHHEPVARAWFVMIDDAPEPRALASHVSLPASWRAVSLHHPRHDRAQVFRVGKGIVSAVLLAMKWIQANTDAAFALKLDTDSLVIRPFRQPIAQRFAAVPTLGIVGAYRTTPNGTPRDWSHHARTLRAMLRPPFSVRHPLRRLMWKPDPRQAHLVDLVERANAHGYDLAEHCMGGGYAVARSLLDAMARAGQLDDVTRWMGVDLPEDVTLGLHCRANAFTLADALDTFGVRYEGLPFLPQELVDRGYAVIHAVKNDPRLDEARVRAFFKAQRAGGRQSPAAVVSTVEAKGGTGVPPSR
jgi:hypothetical protein